MQREINVNFSIHKMQFKVTEVSYMGNTVTSQGLKPDGKRLKPLWRCVNRKTRNLYNVHWAW